MPFPSRYRCGVGLAVVLVVCGLAAGCASPKVHESRSAPTGIAKGDAVAFLLLNYEVKEPAEVGPRDHAAIEQTLFSCLSKELENAELGLLLVSPQAFREAAFPGQKADQLPKSPEAVLELLVNGRTIGNSTMSRPRYVVLLEAGFWEAEKKPPIGLASGAGVVIGEQWARSVTNHATVLDLAHRRVAGHLSADLFNFRNDARMRGVLLAYGFIPVPIVMAKSDDAVCTELGRALARFLAQ